ncbi:hypothetical protein MTR67_035184 [Solanum verrucosum]|uniref:Secreted protein n=1 Tax=Solanum verrucosum TaxID=315347 RepID=A0AAF0U9R1_SOLVR|nr:hypothetical protein MTR67_035184 [Solanum verrucosum]
MNVRIGCCLMFLMNCVCIKTQISLRQCQNKPKRLEEVLRVPRCTPEVQRPLEQLQERWYWIVTSSRGTSQVLNLARRPTTLAPEVTDDDSTDEDDYVDPTP